MATSAAIEIVEEPIEDDSIKEAWARSGASPYGGVGAYLIPDAGGWHVSVVLAEFIREEPLESAFRCEMRTALARAPGVRRVSEADREIWLVEGEPAGPQLIRAAASVVDATLLRFEPDQ